MSAPSNKQKSAFIKDLKIIIIFNSGTGKTSVVNKYTKDIFSDDYKETMVCEFGFKIFEQKGKLYRINLCDLCGKDKGGNFTKSYAKDANGCVFVSDATDDKSREE